MMKKIVVPVVLLTLSAVIGIIFLLTRPGDYMAHFTINTSPEIAYYNVLNWDIWNRNESDVKIDVINKNPVSKISQKVSQKDTTFIFNWEFKKMNDSLTLVRVCVSDPKRLVYNRLNDPFFNTLFKKSVRNNLLDVKTRMELMLNKFRYKYTGLNRFEKKSCVYVNLKCERKGKARAMMSNVIRLNQFVRQNNLGLDGNPFLVIHDWSTVNDSISFDFCFPIIRTDKIPSDPDIKFMTVESMDALKTDFYGNYSITDVSWFGLSEEIRKHGYRGNNKIIEVFYNDPHSGGNELEWKAEIYMGIEPRN